MLNISKEVDIEMSENNSDYSEDYNGGRTNVNDSASNSPMTSKTSSIVEITGNSRTPNFINHSYYKQIERTKSHQTRNDNDYFDPEDMAKLFNGVNNTGDKNDSDDSSKTYVENQYTFEQASKLDKLRSDIFGNSKLDSRHLKLINKTLFNTVCNRMDNPDFISSKKPTAMKKSIYNNRKNSSKLSTLKDPSDMDSITLFIKVPRSKLLSHIKEKTMPETRSSISCKSTSSYNVNESTSSQLNSNTIKLNENSNISTSVNDKSTPSSPSDVTSCINKSKQIIKDYKKAMIVSNKKLQTHNIFQTCLIDKSEKETQTPFQSEFHHDKSNNNDSNYFLCNICHKIVPGYLSAICMQLTCSAIVKCDQLFHSDLDLIMHLPVKHTFEFESYKICVTCNLMFHPSNTVKIKGSNTCLDCLANE